MELTSSGSQQTNTKSDKGKNDPKAQSSKPSYIVAAAIDFGTTFTGYAYSFKDNIANVYTSRWSIPNTQGYSVKAPTNVMLKPDKTFDSFGYDAQVHYQQLLEDGENEGWYFFEKFKMKLYETKPLKRDVMLTDISGKSIPAADIFEMTIRYIKEKTEKEIIGACGGIRDDDILWVITVPAIWSDSAKQFMRESGNKAGIPDERLKLALEPEAASVYVNNQKMCKVKKIDGTEIFQEFTEGHKYIVADLGGGTADLSAHEILPDRNIKELHSANGGAYGGVLVDRAFRKLLDEIFGETIMRRLLENNQGEMYELQMAFETKKRVFKSKDQHEIRFTIPITQLSEIAEKEGSSFSEITERNIQKFGDKVKLKKNKLTIAPAVVEEFFKEAIGGIVKFIENMLKDGEKEMINTLVLVGGFSESQYVAEIIKDKFRGMRTILPREPSLAVLKGAVLMGFKPYCITERKARFSYGFGFSRRFVDGEHPERLKVKHGNVWMCNSIFVKFVTKGQILKGGEHYCTLSRHSPQTLLGLIAPVVTPIYKSASKDPKYTDEDDCELIGKFIMFPPSGVWPPLTMFLNGVIIGESELTVFAVNSKSFEILEAKLDFLSGGDKTTKVMTSVSSATAD